MNGIGALEVEFWVGDGRDIWMGMRMRMRTRCNVLIITIHIDQKHRLQHLHLRATKNSNQFMTMM